MPALQVSRPDVNQALQHGAKGSTSGRGNRVRNALVISQVALSLLLLSGAGLLLKSFFQLRATNPGFEPERVMFADISVPRITYTVKHHCVEGWTAIATWTGVPVSVVADLVRPTPDARYLRFDSFDSRYYNGWDLASAMHPQTILAYAYNDRPLMVEHGAPLRLYSPIKLGYKLTKYLTAMTFTRERPGGYWEDQGYPWLGGV